MAALCLCFPGAQKGLAFFDDFNRPGAGYTNTGGSLGWYWQCSGSGCWSRLNHELYANNSDSSPQTLDQVLYNTRVTLQSGNWSASVDVRDETATRRVGMVFMVSGGGTNHYQIRLAFGTQNVQVLKRGAAGNTTIYSVSNSSSEVFDTGNWYRINAWSTNATRFNWTIINSASNPVAGGSFTDAGYTNGYAGVIKSVGDDNSDIAHFDNFYVREITVPPITRPHPRLLITPADIDTIKNAISAHIEPRYSTWLNLKSRADSWCKASVVAPYTGRDSSLFLNTIVGAGHQASKMALAYLLNGNAAHAAKAKEILLAWAQATPMPGTDFDPTIRFPNSGMETTRGVIGLIYAYDCLYNELSPSERTAVETWFRALLPTIQRGIDRWNTPFEKSSSDPRGYAESSNIDNIYFGGQLYQNHLVSHTMGYLLIGYALGDQELVQFAVDSKENPRHYLALFDGMILMAGDPYVNSGDPMNPPPQNGEIVDRYRHIDTGSGHTNGAGLAYASLSLNQMMAMSEALFLNGLNIYTRVGAFGETLVQPFSYYADFYRLADTSIKGGFYTGESLASNNYEIAEFEVANKRYPDNPAITALLKSVNRAAVDPGGYVETYFCYPTLTHGVFWGGTTISIY